jgi:hypothetical protein
MQKSSIYLFIALGAIVTMSVIGCWELAALISGTSTNTHVHVAGAEVDLEKLTAAFEEHVNSGSQDINAFEKEVNDKSKGIYLGDEYVNVTMREDGEVVGYLNENTKPTYEKGEDSLVFSLQVEQEKKRVVAHDSGHRYYAYHPTGSGFFTGYLIGSMLSNQRSYYGGGYYSAPASANWVKPGYHASLKSSYRSPSVRSGSYGRSSGPSYFGSDSSYSPSRSGYRSGGSGFGK